MAVHMSLCIVLAVLFSVFLSAFSFAELSNAGFTVDLIHIDSISQQKNSTSIYWDLVNRAIQRSKNRADRLAFRSFVSAVPEADLVASDGDFLMKLSLGEPAVEIRGVIDTSSALSWTQCGPSDHSFTQILPLFIPKSSSTYKSVPGSSNLCKSLGGRPSIVGDNTCRYSVNYLHGSYSHGTISTDTLRTNSGSTSPMILLRNFTFGCSYENVGKFKPEATGVISLGGGPASFIAQMNSVIGGKFSYCLLYQGQRVLKSSKMHFGSKALVSGADVVSTGLQILRNSYALKFKGISVGKSKLAASSKILGLFSERIIIDPGTVLTHLPRKIYEPLEAAMKKEIKFELVQPKDVLRLCYKTVDGKMRAPIVTVHFVGAAVRLYPVNTFIKVSQYVHCLGFVPHDGVAIFGNLAQVNFLVGYDLRRKMVSFKQTDCSKD
ncbi:eukaryotic aspartyl protease family protein [Striga asiatica]|uniref:Eukaryotic aspartyl protease family protein n=1 Tax=Striga asiatica TaxID=4170 RepID=A0A5A7QJ64_STRAF|nr:eukaryotic aspartyl protease family protein [Striga asiatica]